MKRHNQKYHFICVACTSAFNSRQEVQQHIKECSKVKRFQKIDLSFTEAFRRGASLASQSEENMDEPGSSQEYPEDYQDTSEDIQDPSQGTQQDTFEESHDISEDSQDDSGHTTATDSENTTLETSGSSSHSFFDLNFNPDLWSCPNPFLLQMAAQIQSQVSDSSSEMETEVSDDSIEHQPELESIKQETPEAPASVNPLEVARTIVFLRVLQLARLRMMLLRNEGVVDAKSVAVKQEPQSDEPPEGSEDNSSVLEDSDSGNGSNQNLAAELDKEITESAKDENSASVSNQCLRIEQQDSDSDGEVEEIEDSESVDGDNENRGSELASVKEEGNQNIKPELDSDLENAVAGIGSDQNIKMEQDSETEDSQSVDENVQNRGKEPDSDRAAKVLENPSSVQDLKMEQDSDGETEDSENTQSQETETATFKGSEDADSGNLIVKSELDSEKETDLEANVGSNSCSECNKIFPSALTLKSHLKRVHSRTLKCKECTKTFSRQSGLLIHHKRKHLKESYICKECNLKFCDSFSLSDHVKGIHEKSQSFNCDKCEMIFPIRKAFYKHKYTEHPNNKWTCEFCNAEFKSKFRLEQHQLNHHGK